MARPARLAALLRSVYHPADHKAQPLPEPEAKAARFLAEALADLAEAARCPRGRSARADEAAGPDRGPGGPEGAASAAAAPVEGQLGEEPDEEIFR